MKRFAIAACTVAAAVLTMPAMAQWPPYPTPNVPTTPDGKVDLEGPAPRTAEGKPDFTGIWERAPAAQEAGDVDSDLPPLATFFDIGANLEGGPPFRPWARELREQRMADGMKDNPDAHCLPMGHMQFHLHPQPRKIIQTPEVIVLLYEGNGGVRQIFTDGRPLPDGDAQPWWYGYSAGRWEGDTLVVETVGLLDGGWLDVNGSPQTDEARIIERFRRPDFGSMQIDVTIDDPKAYEEPFTVRVDHQIMLDTDLIEFVCLENERSREHFDP